MNCQRRWPRATPEMQTKFMLLFFGHICLPFSLTWRVSLTCKGEFLQENENKSASMWDREIEKNSTVWKVEKRKKKKKNKVLDCMKPGYYKEVLDFSNIKYYIIFLIIQIPG